MSKFSTLKVGDVLWGTETRLRGNTTVTHKHVFSVHITEIFTHGAKVTKGGVSQFMSKGQLQKLKKAKPKAEEPTLLETKEPPPSKETEPPRLDIDQVYDPVRGQSHGDWGIDFFSTLMDEGEIDMDPPYQRDHVWTETQQMDFMGFLLEGGRAPEFFVRELPYTDPRNPTPPYYEIVDGKQRMLAMYRWWKGEIPARLGPEYNYRLIWMKDFGLVSLRRIKRDVSCNVQFLKEKTDAQIMRLYLRLNRGGTPHTEEEIAKVQTMLEALKKEKQT